MSYGNSMLNIESYRIEGDIDLEIGNLFFT